MSRAPIRSEPLNNFLGLSERHPDSECRTTNWWLYDSRCGMNLAMRTRTRDEALVQGIEYWAKRANEYESKFRELAQKVEAFVGQVSVPEDSD